MAISCNKQQHLFFFSFFIFITNFINNLRKSLLIETTLILKCIAWKDWCGHWLFRKLFQWISPGLSSHRYSVIFSADSEIFAFSAMFRAEPADLNFDIAGHNWFIDEHFWTSLIQRWTLLTSSKQAKTMKKVKKGVFFLILMLKRREIGNFRITLMGYLEKI